MRQAVVLILITAALLAALYLLPGAPPVEPQQEVQLLASGLEVPWALVFAPDGRLFFTERPGRVSWLDTRTGNVTLVAEVPVASTGEAGLLGLAIDPDFGTNGLLYVYYTYEGGGVLFNRISRFPVDQGMAGEEILLDGIPGAPLHDGGRLKFGPDGKLYATAGDAQRPEQAQNTSSLAGKILRINRDGSVPADNPFPGSPVWSYGHRNPQSLAWDSQSNLWSTEHGPTGNDEVNRIEAGKGYGWPAGQCEGAAWCFQQAVAPSGAAIVGDHLYIAALRGERLLRARLAGDRVVEVVTVLEGYGRLRDVVVGPDGALYVATSNRDGRGEPAQSDDRVLKVRPE